ncbi:MAG: type II secretion system protein GspJ [endosymbiont of Galathealinum brachiosum]|uniref:Type II secretion system protein J n=1 Tax=endosymbiont of Galathealinum brachiosum TaxID=2200906 RepID=A0A370DDG5_9GAMM|nr:MAG: type II secretion system protein GspJ [endosymbiont of Galathealinum brachiosum]
MPLNSLQKKSGFTLIEVIIAMAIFAIVSVLAYTGLHSVITSKSRTEAALDRLQELQMSVLTLTGDLQYLSNRDGHDALGGQLLKVTTQDSDYILAFTRNGWRNPANQARSSLQRVAYQLDEDRLKRIYWPHVDRADDEQVVERTLITNIESLELRFLDEKNQWQTDWPSADSQASDAPSALPVAVEFTLKMNDWGDIRRLIRVAYND